MHKLVDYLIFLFLRAAKRQQVAHLTYSKVLRMLSENVPSIDFLQKSNKFESF